MVNLQLHDNVPQETNLKFIYHKQLIELEINIKCLSIKRICLFTLGGLPARKAKNQNNGRKIARDTTRKIIREKENCPINLDFSRIYIRPPSGTTRDI